MMSTQQPIPRLQAAIGLWKGSARARAVAAFDRRVLRANAATLIALLGTAVALPVAQSQDQPVSFSHGFFSQGSRWANTATYLRDRAAIETLTPSTPWNAYFDEQSTSLQGQLNTWNRSGIVGIAHSNGGLVVRNYLHLAGGGARINRLITIGTPHQGAPIAGNLLNGRVVAYFGGMAFTIGQAFQFYADNDPAWYTYPVVGASVESAARVMQQLGQLLQDNNVFAGIGIGAALPVTTQDVPNSAFITQNVNSPANIALEGGVLSARIGVATQLDPNGAILHILTSDPVTARRVRAIAMAAALNLYLYYSEHPDWWLASHADYWLDMYWYLRQMDVAWADFTGVMLGWQGPFAVVAPSDGFIPQASATYPNGSGQRFMQLPQYNISHTQQTDHPAVRSLLAFELTNTFGIPARASAPPPEQPPASDCHLVGGQIVCSL